MIGRYGKGGSLIQSILFPKSQWTKNEAVYWLETHGFKAAKVDTQANHIRFRQRPPSACKPFTYGTKVWISKKKNQKRLPKPKKILVVFCQGKKV